MAARKVGRPKKKTVGRPKKTVKRAATTTRKTKKRGRGRPLGFKCTPKTRAKMKKSALLRWRGSKKKTAAVSTKRKSGKKRGPGRPAGFKHSAATIKKMRKSQRARHT